ncbi:SGNH/GDSL hydrolase family protein [Heyndrickxia sporothermodurans]
MRKKFISIIAILMLVSSLFTSSAFAKSGHAKKSLVALGDSITFGYNLDENNDHPSKVAFPSIIGKDTDMRVRNLGVPGWSTEQLLNALRNDDKFRQAVRHADIITLNIGSNDFLQGLLASIENPDVLPGILENMVENISSIISEIQSLSDAKIVVYNIFNPFPTESGVHAYVDYILPPVNSDIYSVIQSSNGDVFLADAYSAIGDDQSIYIIKDDNHPTDLGHKILAEIAIKALGL